MSNDYKRLNPIVVIMKDKQPETYPLEPEKSAA
jgi:hypothetical protein